MLIDTHTHLYLDDFAPAIDSAVKRAFEAGVDKLIFPNVDLQTIEPMNCLHNLFPENTYMAIGLHPTEIGDDWKSDLAKIESELLNDLKKYVAIGEVGIDLYWDKSYRDQQIEAFSCQVDWALEHDLPVIIHCREGLDEVLDVLSSKIGPVKGVFHSFGGTVQDVERIRAVGDFYFGINGIVTFKNSKLCDTLSAIGIDRIVLETDSPYLAPVPFRGKRNESAYIVYVAERIADLMGISVAEVVDKTGENAAKLFSIPL